MNSTLIIFILVPQLQSLMADAMDTLEGRRDDKERVWNTIQKVKLSKLKEKRHIILREKCPSWVKSIWKIKRKVLMVVLVVVFVLMNAALFLKV